MSIVKLEVKNRKNELERYCLSYPLTKEEWNREFDKRWEEKHAYLRHTVEGKRMDWEEIINNLSDLIDYKNTKLRGQEIAIEHLKSQKEKLLRELMYLRSRYDSKVEREVVDTVINLTKKIYE